MAPYSKPALIPPPAIQVLEAPTVMVAAVVVFGQLALRVDRAAELAAGDHEGVLEQAALLQVHDESGEAWSVSLH